MTLSSRRLAWLAGALWVALSAGAALPVAPTRSRPDDLEWAGAAGRGFIARADLLSLPQVVVTNRNDPELERPIVYTGVLLDELLRALPAEDGADILWAECADGYAKHYSKAYAAAMRPLLILRMDGKDPDQWPKTSGGASLGPYYIGYEAFSPRPSETVAGQPESARIPYGVVRIRLARESMTVARFAVPQASGAVLDGQKLAVRECSSCHFLDDVGGRMSQRPWLILAAWAKAGPDYFQRYVRNPKAVQPASKMPGFHDWSPAAVEAVRAYFAAFADLKKAP